MNILNKIKINLSTYFLVVTFLICGLFNQFIVVFLILLFHELGHLFFLKKFKRQISTIEILPTGVIIKEDSCVNSNIYEDLLISFGGIFSQIIFYLVIIISFQNDFFNNRMYNLFCHYNMILLIFNLIPIYPLDGYQILKLFCELFIPYKLTFLITYIISLICLILLFLINWQFHLNNYLILFFLFYKLIENIKSIKYFIYRFYLERINYNFNFKIKLFNHANLNKMYKNKYHYFKINGKYINEKKLIEKKFIN